MTARRGKKHFPRPLSGLPWCLVAGCFTLSSAEANGNSNASHPPAEAQTATTTLADVSGQSDEAQPVVQHIYFAPDGQAEWLRFSAMNREFSVLLEPNTDLFTPTSVVIRDGTRMSLAEAGLKPPLRGVVEGDPKSWARLRQRGNATEGLIFADGRLLELRLGQASDGESSSTVAEAELDDFLEHSQGGKTACGTTPSSSRPAENIEPGSRRQEPCQWIDIQLIADFTHVAELGGNAESEAEMVARINEVDGIYRTDLNYGLKIEEVSSHSTVGGPAYNVQDIAIFNQLMALGGWKQENNPDRGLVHLFIRRGGQILGIAPIGATCDPETGVGVSNYVGPGRMSTILPTHEIGHNFGANHDSVGGFIMETFPSSEATQFSDASKAEIAAHVGGVDCFTSCDSGTGGGTGTGGSGTGGAGTGGAGTGGSGTGGLATGGALGSGGAGTGGNVGITGGAPSSGGESATGGSIDGVSTGGGSSQGQSSNNKGNDEQGGCGCAIPGKKPAPPAPLALGLLGLLTLLTRRKRSTR